MIYENEEYRITLPNGPLAGMYEALMALGVHFEGGTSGEFCSNPQIAQRFINSYTESDALSFAITERCAAVAQYSKTLHDAVIANISPGEMASWTVKATEAARFKSGADVTEYPMLAEEANHRGVTVAELVVRVDANAAEFKSVEAWISGTDGKHRDAIKRLTTVQEVRDYDSASGWPPI